jgi:pyruvate/2-oxoglutarate dehydrogenase complex dihydrolipoamide dehydrogenase (E3) component
MSKQFDVIVIGGGPGGYIAAIRAAQLGKNVACVDEWKNATGGPAPGGTCTNVGCIPSKALLQSSEHFEQASHHFADHGITVKGLSMDAAKMVARKDAVVKQNNEASCTCSKRTRSAFSTAVPRLSKPLTVATRSRSLVLLKKPWSVSRSLSPPAPMPVRCRARRLKSPSSCPTKARWRSPTCRRSWV